MLLRKGSVSYDLWADFSLPHCLVVGQGIERQEPFLAGISDPRTNAQCPKVSLSAVVFVNAWGVPCVFYGLFEWAKSE